MQDSVKYYFVLRFFKIFLKVIRFTTVVEIFDLQTDLYATRMYIHILDSEQVETLLSYEHTKIYSSIDSRKIPTNFVF